MLFLSSLLAALLAVGCRSQLITNASPFPSNSQNWLLNQELTCAAQRGRFFTAWNHTFNATISTTTPVAVSPGDPIYFTNTVIGVTIPSQHVVCAIAANASQASVSADVDWAVTDAAPGALTAFSGNITGVPLLFTGDVLLRIPLNISATLPPLGPVTISRNASTSTALLSKLDLYVQPLDSAANEVGGPVWISCGRQSSDVVIASVNVGLVATGSSNSSAAANVSSTQASGLATGTSGRNAISTAVGLPAGDAIKDAINFKNLFNIYPSD